MGGFWLAGYSAVNRANIQADIQRSCRRSTSMFEGVETSVVQGLERVFRIFAESPDWWGFRAFHQGLSGVLGKGCEYAVISQTESS